MYVVPDEYNNNNGTSNLTPTTKHNPQNNENNGKFNLYYFTIFQKKIF